MQTYSHHKKGFTLIEILVVAGIIGFILAIMFPIMGKAKSVAKRATCINNLRQLYFAMLSYVDDHNGTYPSSSFSIASLLPYMDDNKENTKCPIEDKYYDEGIISYGYNGNLAGIMWARSKTPLPDTMLFCDSGSAVITYSDEPDLNRHGRNLGQAIYADGHVGIVDTQYLVTREGPPPTTPSPTTSSPTTPPPTTTLPTTPPPTDTPPPECFLAGTPVLMADGTTKPIEKLTIGEAIMAFDENTNSFKPDKIKQVFVFPDNDEGYFVINNHIKVTPHHRFYTVSGLRSAVSGNYAEHRKPSLDYARDGSRDGEHVEPNTENQYVWKEAGLLKLGDRLFTSKDTLEPITSIEKVEAKVTVYNLEVNPYHTFIAGGVVVHNSKIIPHRGCFLAGTPILMADRSTKPIEDIKVGDKILAFDEESGEIKLDKVKRTFVFPEEPGYLIINGGIKVTSQHRFMTGDKWVKAGELKLGDKLLTSKDKLEPITSIERIEAKVTVYNLEVNPYHTFIANGVVVHNARLLYADEVAK